jgi:hypothetical protein
MGSLKKRCFDPLTGIPDSLNNVCGTCSEGLICGKMLKNPDDGVTSFDTIGSSALIIY